MSGEMEILVQADTDNKENLLKSFENNKIKFQHINFFDNDENCYLIPEFIDALVVFDCHMLEDLFNTDAGVKSIFRFLKNKKNKLWVYQDIDNTIFLTSQKFKKILFYIDKNIIFSNIFLIHDSHLVKKSFFYSFKNIKNYIKPLPDDFSRFPTISEKIKKGDDSKFFLLTTVVKHCRPHRKILANQLRQRNNLLDNSHIIMHNNSEDAHNNWIGEQTTVHGWQDGNPSMDLYNNSLFELVPETEYKQLYLITEKIIKPIATMTPFLILSTMGYLDFLRSIGFKTFDGIIDESYDLEHRVEDRSRMILNELENILHKGPKTVYKECLPILEHNFHHLMYLSGSHDYKHDEFIRYCLEKTKQNIQ